MLWKPDDLLRILSSTPDIAVRRDVPLATLGKWRIGGPADVVIEPASAEQAASVMKALQQSTAPFTVIGDGSNLLFDDAGYRGVIVRIGAKMAAMQVHPDGTVEAEAGVWVPNFVRRVGGAGFTGCVHAIGIPGTLGGLILMNGGSQRKGIGEQLVDVTIVDETGEIRTLTKEECAFSYRHSTLQSMNAIVVGGRFAYALGDKAGLRKEMLAILAERNRKFPRKLPNCGSVFLSDPAMYATVGPPGLAIERAGLKGTARGGAQISPMHANFIVNNGGATSGDVLGLVRLIRTTVHDQTGFWMDCEVRHLAPDGQMRPAHMAAEKLAA